MPVGYSDQPQPQTWNTVYETTYSSLQQLQSMRNPVSPSRDPYVITGEPINNIINRVGIEFEGAFDPPFMNKLREDNLFSCVHSDSSINFGITNLAVGEMLTNPLNISQLNKVIDLMKWAIDNNLYRINATCGLHYHLSLHKEYYGYLVNSDFYKSYRQMMKDNFPQVYSDRRNNKYCNYAVDDGHFDLDSHRYHAINYCYTKHHTIEFRSYGGNFATIGGLGECINKTIDLVTEYCTKVDNKTVVEKKYEFDSDGEGRVKTIKLDVDKIRDTTRPFMLEGDFYPDF